MREGIKMKIKNKIICIGIALSIGLVGGSIEKTNVHRLSSINISYAADQDIIDQIKETIERSKVKLAGIEFIKKEMPETTKRYEKVINEAIKDVKSSIQRAEKFLKAIENEENPNDSKENSSQPKPADNKKPSKPSSQKSQIDQIAAKLMGRKIYSKSGLIRKLVNDYGFSKDEATKAANKFGKEAWIKNAVHVLSTKYDYTLKRSSENYLRRKLRDNYGFTQDEIDQAIRKVLY